MGDLADTPLCSAFKKRSLLIFKLAVIAYGLLLTTISWGVTVPVGSILNLAISAEFEGQLNATGEISSPKEHPINYSVKAVNQGNGSISDVEFQSSIHFAEPATCNHQRYEAGARLPGAPFSPIY